MGNICMKLLQSLASGSGGDIVYRFSMILVLVAIQKSTIAGGIIWNI